MKSSISGIQTFHYGQELVFDAFIQYKEYIGFVKAMNSLKGMKLLYKDRYENDTFVANIKVRLAVELSQLESIQVKPGLKSDFSTHLLLNESKFFESA